MNYICAQAINAMNLQTILAPIEDLFLWTFSLLEASGDLGNNFLILVFTVATIYWTVKLIGYSSSEVPNR